MGGGQSKNEDQFIAQSPSYNYSNYQPNMLYDSSFNPSSFNAPYSNNNLLMSNDFDKNLYINNNNINLNSNNSKNINSNNHGTCLVNYSGFLNQGKCGSQYARETKNYGFRQPMPKKQMGYGF